MTKKTRYAQVGLGGRSEMYSQAVILTYAETSELAGFCDINQGRLERRVNWAREHGCAAPGYLAADFDRMIAETRPDTVIVTSKDCTHDEYIVRAMELGCDVITEKPMTIDETKCRRILETQRRTGRKVTVTFNYRYSPPRTQLKDLLMSGVIGEVLSVDFHWMLDINHGADYFRRWHRNKVNSGGLLVHKATHHFDLVNWWLGTAPESVFATGHRHFYVPATAERLGLTGRGERCHGCPAAAHCSYYLDLAANPELKGLYLDQEKYDGYLRDQCVFSDRIDIEDTMNLAVNYASGVKMSYSLNAFMPWEGYTIMFNGTKGRLEHKCEESVYINGDGTVPGQLRPDGTWTRIYPHRQNPYQVEIWQAVGGHGGGDDLLLADIFAADKPEDPYRRRADQRGGAWSIMTGIAANRSIATGEVVRIADLVPELELPEYPPMTAEGETVAENETVPVLLNR